MAVVILITNGGRIQASYRGREYVEVSFGTSDTPTDVINVFDYKADKPVIPNTPKAVERVLVRWLRERNPDIEVYETRLMA